MEPLLQGSATVSDERRSASWAGAEPKVSVVVATHQRAAYLRELLEVLGDQTVGTSAFEVIVCDDGSTDDTWGVLEQAVADGALRLCALRLPRSGGPSGARNAASAQARADIIAFTDDDCLPTPGWLDALARALVPGVDVVQGAVTPAPTEREASGPWDKTLWVSGPTPWFETANIAYRRALFERLGGFIEADGVSRRPGGMAFGEDCLLGARAMAAGAGRSYEAAALVHHRCIPGDFSDYLETRRRLVGFPALARRSEPIREYLLAGVFLTPRSAAFDLSLVGLALAILRRQPLWLLVSLWYVRAVWPDVRRRRGGPRTRAIRLVQLAYGDAVGFAWLLRGSLRHRRPVL
ncbi:MAG: glycosyltransferase [Acidimicrobiales bacterium]